MGGTKGNEIFFRLNKSREAVF